MATHDRAQRDSLSDVQSIEWGLSLSDGMTLRIVGKRNTHVYRPQAKVESTKATDATVERWAKTIARAAGCVATHTPFPADHSHSDSHSLSRSDSHSRSGLLSWKQRRATMSQSWGSTVRSHVFDSGGNSPKISSKASTLTPSPMERSQSMWNIPPLDTSVPAQRRRSSSVSIGSDISIGSDMSPNMSASPLGASPGTSPTPPGTSPTPPGISPPFSSSPLEVSPSETISSSPSYSESPNPLSLSSSPSFPLLRPKPKQAAKEVSSIFDVWGIYFPATLLAFGIGYLGWSFLWVAGLLYFVYKLEQYQLNEWRSEMANKETKPNKVEVGETCEWLNVLCTQLWPHIQHDVAESIKATANDLFAGEFPGGFRVSVDSVDGGDVAPVMTALEGEKPATGYADFQLDLHLRYAGDVVMHTRVTRDCGAVQLRLPVTVDRLRLSTRMRLGWTFCPRAPFLHTLTASILSSPSNILSSPSSILSSPSNILSSPSSILSSPSSILPSSGVNTLSSLPSPAVTLAVRPLGLSDALGWLGTGDQLRAAMAEACESLEWPQRVTVEWAHRWWAVETVGDVTRDDVTRDDVARHHREVTAARAAGECAGLALVWLRGARKVPLELLGASQPFCILAPGSYEVFASSHVSRSRSPQWNEFFEVLVKKQVKPQLEITLMGRDPVHGHDNFVGMGVVSLDGLGPESLDLWVPLTRPSKRGDVPAGEVQLTLRFMPDAS